MGRIKFSESQIADIVMSIIGEVEPIGESNFDEKAYKNLVLLQDVIDCLIHEVQVCLPYRYRLEGSMNKIGRQAASYLKSQHDWLDDLCEEMAGKREWNSFIEGTST